MKLHADTDRCIGAGMCVMTDDAVFDQDDDGVVVVLGPAADGDVPGDAQQRVREAVKLCPSGALSLGEG